MLYPRELLCVSTVNESIMEQVCKCVYAIKIKIDVTAVANIQAEINIKINKT